MKYSDLDINYKDLERRVVAWADTKGILAHASAQTQAEKTMEEVEELLDALAVNDKEEIANAYGDILVTIIIGSKMSGMDLLTELEKCVTEIEARNGQMVNGKFVKDAS